MISAPGIGCVAIKLSSSVSAGGQSEHPSDVNSSTITGVVPSAPLRSGVVACVPTHAASSATTTNDDLTRCILRILAPQLNPTFRTRTIVHLDLRRSSLNAGSTAFFKSLRCNRLTRRLLSCGPVRHWHSDCYRDLPRSLE